MMLTYQYLTINEIFDVKNGRYHCALMCDLSFLYVHVDVICFPVAVNIWNQRMAKLPKIF